MNLIYITTVIILLLINPYPYIDISLSQNNSGISRVNVILNYLVINEGNDAVSIVINDLLSHYCFETIYRDQFINRANLIINTTSVSLQSINGCLRTSNNLSIEIPPKSKVNITLLIETLVDLKHRLDELSEALYFLTNSSLRIPIDSPLEDDSTNLWNYTHPLLKLAIKYIRRKTMDNGNPVLEVLGYINRNIVYSITFPSRYPWETIVLGSGDCDDQSNLIITILRGLGFNAYIEFGIVPIDRSYVLSFSSSDKRLNYTYIGGFMHSWVLLKIVENLSIRIDPVVAKPYSNPTQLVSNAYFYVKPILVFKMEPYVEDYILKQYSSIHSSLNTGLFFNITLSIYSEAPLTS